MSLTDFTGITTEFEWNGAKATLRSLNMSEVMDLLVAHGGFITEAYSEFGGLLVRGEAFQEFALRLAVGAPSLVAAAIAQSADEPTQAEFVAKLPLGTQIAMSVQILVMTFMYLHPEEMWATLQEALAPFATHLHGTMQ